MNRKGFTLIELLIVIAIIGILASSLLVGLGGARASARDARRISDIRQTQSVLELYFAKCGIYPGDASCSTANNPIDWNALESVLKASNIGVSGIPKDPSPPNTTYEYAVDGNNLKYILKANLEQDNQALNNDIDGTPAGFSIGCDDPAYCVSL